MPIRINLKELFDSDSQPIAIDKLNFNFNKLLELGIGLPGDKGITGPQGGVGPAGIQGPIGDDGNQWYVGSGDPNPQTFNDLEGGDFYLDTSNSSIWQYDGNTETWNVIIDFGSVINNYLNLFGITFIRGLGTGSPDDNRYILFPNRGNSLIDRGQDILGGDSNNDIFFLSNFNEKLGVVSIANFPTNTSDLYSAIQKIYIDSTLGIPGRYHLELGSLYQDTNGTLDNYLSDLKANLKFRHSVDDLGGSSNFPLTNNYIYLGKISLSKPELDSITEIDYNAALEIITPKYNNEGGPVTRAELTARIGSKEAVGEYFTGVNIDGITMDLGGLGGKIGIGIAKSFQSIRPQADGKDYLMLEGDDNIDAIYLKGETYQDGGNIEQLSTGSVGLLNKKSDLNYVELHWKNQGLAVAGTKLITVSGERSPASIDTTGRLSLFDISNPVSPILDYSASLGNSTEEPDKFGGSDPTSYILGPGISDVQIAGEYAYFVNNQDAETGLGVPPLAGQTKSFSRFQIGKIYNDTTVADQVSRISILTDSIPELEGAYRLEVRGKWAWVICNLDRTNNVDIIGALTAIDISDPTFPVISDSYQEVDIGTRYIAFDVADGSAAVLRTTIRTGLSSTIVLTVDLLLFDLTDPTNFSTNTPKLTNATTSIFSGITADPLNPARFGAVKILGKYAYVLWHDKLCVYDIQVANVTTLPKISETPIEIDIALGNETYGIDLEVVGTTAYILAYDDQTDPANPGVVIKMDISDPTNPFVISSTGLSGLAKPSRIKYSGKYLYVNGATDSTTAQEGGLIVLDVDGIKSPGAQIDSIRTSQLHVDRHAVIQENLSVNHSLNVGPGGIYVDAGQGITSDGPIVSTDSFLSQRSDKTIRNDIYNGLLAEQGGSSIGATLLGSMYRIKNCNLIPEGSVAINRLYGNVIGIKDVTGVSSFQVIRAYDAAIIGTTTENYNGYVSYSSGSTYSGGTVHFGAYNILDQLNGPAATIFFGAYLANTGSATKYGIKFIGDEKNELDGDLDIGGNVNVSGAINNLNESLHVTSGEQYHSPGEHAVSSGQFSFSNIYSAFAGTWMKVGNVIHVAGVFQGILSAEIPLPVVPGSSGTIHSLAGIARRDLTNDSWGITFNSSSGNATLYSAGFDPYYVGEYNPPGPPIGAGTQEYYCVFQYAIV